MTSHDLADELLDAIDDAKRIPKRRIINGDLAGFRDDLKEWKETKRRWIRTRLGREDALQFEDVADVEILGPTWPYLEEVIDKYDGFLSALSERVRKSGSLSTVRSAPDPSSDRVIETFCSYSSRDEAFRTQLDVHLAPLIRERLIQIWNFRKLEAGVEWDAEIRKHLASAELVLPLVSADFIASDYSWGQEMAYALTRHREGRTRVVPIIIRECDWRGTPLGDLQALPTDGVPVSRWPDPDAAWLNVAQGIRRVLETLRANTPQTAAVTLTDSQRQILQAFVERDIRAGEGFPMGVLVGMRDLGPNLDALSGLGAVEIVNRGFVRLTAAGERLAYSSTG